MVAEDGQLRFDWSMATLSGYTHIVERVLIDFS